MQLGDATALLRPLAAALRLLLVAIAAYLGSGDAYEKAIARFSSTYADQNEKDYEAFAAAVKSGRIVAETGL